MVINNNMSYEEVVRAARHWSDQNHRPEDMRWVIIEVLCSTIETLINEKKTNLYSIR